MATMDDFLRDLKALKGEPDLLVQLPPVDAWALMTDLQFLLRQPQVRGLLRAVAIAVATQIEQTLATTPALAEVAEAGWGDVVRMPAPTEHERIRQCRQ